MGIFNDSTFKQMVLNLMSFLKHQDEILFKKDYQFFLKTNNGTEAINENSAVLLERNNFSKKPRS